MNGNNASNSRNSLTWGVLFTLMAVITIYFGVTGDDGFFAPMLLADLIYLALWLFKPAKSEGKSAYYAIIATGIFNILLSAALSILVPLYGVQWGAEMHLDDQNGILFPVVNDGLENCYFFSILFIFYFVISIYQRLRNRKK